MESSWEKLLFIYLAWVARARLPSCVCFVCSDSRFTLFVLTVAADHVTAQQFPLPVSIFCRRTGPSVEQTHSSESTTQQHSQCLLICPRPGSSEFHLLYALHQILTNIAAAMSLPATVV